MSDQFFKGIEIPVIEGPINFVPKDTEVFRHIDFSNGIDKTCTVTGYYDREKDEFVIQDIRYD